MKKDQWSIYRDNTATDGQDACRLAGIMNAINHPDAERLTVFIDGQYRIIRHPKEHIYNISRDQVVCFVSGLFFRIKDVRDFYGFSETYRWRISKDIVSPSVYNHLRMCEGKKSSWLGRHWLTLDMWYNSKLGPDVEQNQLIMMCLVAGRLNEYCEMTPWWRESLRRYWGDRNEGAFCDYYISYIDGLRNKWIK